MHKLLVLLAALVVLPLFAGAYGALHDQLSFTIAPEYFTRFKYVQFGFDPAMSGGHRPTVALIGFLATWWVGALIALFLGGTAWLRPDAHAMRKAIARGTMITLGVAASCALLGLAYGWWAITEVPQGWYLPEGVQDQRAFLAVGIMHNWSYGGGLLGLVLALADMERHRIRAKAAVSRTAA